MLPDPPLTRETRLLQRGRDSGAGQLRGVVSAGLEREVRLYSFMRGALYREEEAHYS